jgi:valyl-tRNA synthetase
MLNSSYNHKDIEKRLYEFWLNNNFFAPDKTKDKSFAVAIPPPNVTGILHIGHCLNNSIQDVIVRYKRMDGYSTLWIPGLDHAGISTQQKVLEHLEKKGVNRKDLKKDIFLKEAYEWKNIYGNRILDQFKKLGLSLDWSKVHFTLDESYKNAVKTVFNQLYREKLIYRSKYIINWSTANKTALSDDEVYFKDIERYMWYISYKTSIGENIVIATTRPETILGDSAIAVSPNGKFKRFIGKYAIVPIVGRQIPIISDDYVKDDFGTGALKVTPAHDPNDFAIGERHNLEIINIFDEDCRINTIYKGATVLEARDLILKDLENLGALVKKEKVISSVGFCSKSDTIIEPIISTQWFLKMKPLAKEAIKAVKSGKIKIKPTHLEKTYFNWLNNIRDWCISRQLWWGHDIPVSYKDNEIFLNDDIPNEASNDISFEREQDVLDTWFSSWIWPFVVLGWPEKLDDRFFPLDLVVTGADIIFFWIARMIMGSLHFTKKVPFKHVLFHGIVRDDKGRKMSKSLGNSPDPLEIIERYGSDSLRFALIFNSSIGSDLFYTESWLENASHFCNKLWNTYRYIDMFSIHEKVELDLDVFDKWIISRINQTVFVVRENLDKYNLDIALKEIYQTFWTEFADWYIEITKFNRCYTKEYVLKYVFNTILKLLHPFIPFITEELYLKMKFEESESISISKFPEYNKQIDNIDIDIFKDVVKAIRSVRADLNISLKDRINVEVNILKEGSFSLDYASKMSNSNISLVKSFEYSPAILKVYDNVEINLSVKEIDLTYEIDRLKRALEKDRSELNRAKKNLSSDRFILNAPKDVIDREKRVFEEATNKIEAIEKKLKSLYS